MQTIGKKGEELAVHHLRRQGWRICALNYRYKRSEIDIICQSEQLLLFVEVKSRSSTVYGFPELFVQKRQQNAILRAATHYVKEQQWKGGIRFDIIAIVFSKKGQELLHLKDAFY